MRHDAYAGVIVTCRAIQELNNIKIINVNNESIELV